MNIFKLIRRFNDILLFGTKVRLTNSLECPDSTPDENIKPREKSPISIEEQARAKIYKFFETTDIIILLSTPIFIGPFIFYLLYSIYLWLLSNIINGFDTNFYLGAEWTAISFSCAIFVVGWSLIRLINRHYDKREQYWRTMLSLGYVELERYRLLHGFSVWVDVTDDGLPNFQYWTGQQFRSEMGCAYGQLLILKESSGKWLLIKNIFQTDYDLYAPEKLWLAPIYEEIAITYAPRTNAALSKRFSGQEISMEHTNYIVAHDEFVMLFGSKGCSVYNTHISCGFVDSQKSEQIEKILKNARSKNEEYNNRNAYQQNLFFKKNYINSTTIVESAINLQSEMIQKLN